MKTYELDIGKLTHEEALVAQQAVHRHRIEQLRRQFGEPCKIYVAMQESDLTEGKGPTVPRGYFFLRDEAERVHEALNGVMGSANSCQLQTVDVYATAAEWSKITANADHLRDTKQVFPV